MNVLGSATSASFYRFYHGGTQLFSYYFSANSGSISYYPQSYGTGVGTTASAALSTGMHLVETFTKISATAGQVTIKVDGTQVYASPANLNTGTLSIDTVWFGMIGATTPTVWDYTMDNVDFDGSQWIGPI
jgi:hypothetical protein